MSCLFLFQGIFPTQGSNPRLLHWQVDSFLFVYFVFTVSDLVFIVGSLYLILPKSLGVQGWKTHPLCSCAPNVFPVLLAPRASEVLDACPLRSSVPGTQGCGLELAVLPNGLLSGSSWPQQRSSSAKPQTPAHIDPSSSSSREPWLPARTCRRPWPVGAAILGPASSGAQRLDRQALPPTTFLALWQVGSLPLSHLKAPELPPGPC